MRDPVRQSQPRLGQRPARNASGVSDIRRLWQAAADPAGSQEYEVLLTQLETLFLTSPTFTLQKAFFHLHPTIHTLALLHKLCTALFDADDSPDDDDEDDASDESSIDAEAAALGLGKDVMKEIEGGRVIQGGLVKGGEVLTLIWEMGRNTSGSACALPHRALSVMSSLGFGFVAGTQRPRPSSGPCCCTRPSPTPRCSWTGSRPVT